MVPEEIIQGTYRAILRPGDTAIDCGAHTGYHTKPMLEICREGRVIAYEALPHLAERLANELGNWTSLELKSCAVQADPDIEKISFQFVPERPGRSGILSATINTLETNKYEYQLIEVSASTIDKDVTELGIEPATVAFIKLDLEGGEYNALQGAKETLRSGRPFLAYENGVFAAKTMGYTDHDFSKMLEELDYVRVSVFGNILREPNFDCHYLFAAPEEEAEVLRRILKGLFVASCYRHGVSQSWNEAVTGETNNEPADRPRFGLAAQRIGRLRFKRR